MLSTLMLALATAVAAPEMIPEQDTQLLGRTAPVFEAEMLDGGTFSLEAQRGKPVVLAFWASWCGPCRLELPALEALAKERSDVTIFAVNVDREQALARRFLQQTRVALPIVWDNDADSLGDYQVMSMPTMVLVDANGTVAFTKTGFSKDKGLEELEAALEKLK